MVKNGPTPAGERLIASAAPVLDALARVESEMRALREDREGVVRVATECYTCYHWLPRVLLDYGRLRPRVPGRAGA